jgi:hypothetical protein
MVAAAVPIHRVTRCQFDRPVQIGTRRRRIAEHGLAFPLDPEHPGILRIAMCLSLRRLQGGQRELGLLGPLMRQGQLHQGFGYKMWIHGEVPGVLQVHNGTVLRP